MAKFLMLLVGVLPCLISSALARDDSSEDDYQILVTITFPLDDQQEDTMGHVEVEYTLYSGGLCWNKKTTYGGTEKQDGPDHVAWLSRSHANAVLKLVSQITASHIMPASPSKAILIRGTMTDNKTVARDFSQNILAIHQMLRLLGGTRGDLEGHLADALAVADTVNQRREGWDQRKGVWGNIEGSLWDDIEREASQPGSEVSELLGSNPKAFDTLFNDVGRFDGERSERITLLMIYLDCKMGHKAFIAQLNRQSAGTRKKVSRDLLEILTFKQNIPSSFDELAADFRQNLDAPDR